MNKVIGVVAHVDAGKTTFSEGLLYHTNTIRKMGRVDHQNAYLDNHEIEKERGITIFSDQAVMHYQGDTYYLVDTPGHVDFSPEMERTLLVMDYVIIIISAVEGVQGHTDTVWQLLKKHRIPAFFFINKTDRVGADVEGVLDEIQLNLTKNVFLMKNNIEENFSDELREFLAERNEELLKLYISDDFRQGVWIDQVVKMIKQNEIYICASGSALQDEGILDFLNLVHRLTVTHHNGKGFNARTFKISHDDNENRITHLKILSGKLKVRDEITYQNGEDKITEKITQIRIYNGQKYETTETANPGQLVGVMGLTKTQIGQGLGSIKNVPEYKMTPTLKSKVLFGSDINLNEVIRAFNMLNEEDPSLKVTWAEEIQELHISVMGPIQLEILEKIVKDRFNLSIKFGEPGIIYRETIKNVVTGYGHFEPLKHYAEVHLKIEPGPRNSGIKFTNLCSTDDLAKGLQNLIKQHLLEKEHKGLLTGSPLTDINISLLTGKDHIKHTSGGDFREATLRALRQGLEKAENILLEPYYTFKIKVDSDDIGRVMSDIQKADGDFDPPEASGNKFIIRGRTPVSTFMNYPTELSAFTSGKGVINLMFGGYDLCHNPAEIIGKISYEKKADLEYSSSSIFCSKGQAYIVPWYDAEAKMHCL